MKISPVVSLKKLPALPKIDFQSILDEFRGMNPNDPGAWALVPRITVLTGLFAAVVVLRPGKSIMDLGVSSVKKKWKQKGFAAGVNRTVIEEGAAMLGMELDVLIEHTIKGMQTAAEEIGLKGFEVH